MIQTSTSFIGIIIGSYGISQMVLRLPVGLLADYRNKYKMNMLIGALSSGCASLFRIIFNNGIGFLIGNLFSVFASAMRISFMVLYMSFYPKDKQTKAISSIIVANNLGMLLEFITSTLLYEKIGMQMICLLSVISEIISALFISLLPKEKNTTNKEKNFKFIKSMYTKEFNCLFASCTCSTRGTNDNNYVFYNTNYKKFRNKFYVYRIIFYYLYVISSLFC